MDDNKIRCKCKYCNSINIIRKGFRNTKNRGKIQRYFCKKCKKKFILDDGFYRMRNSSYKITLCLDLFFRGMSLRRIQEHLQAFYPHNSSHMSILRWIRKYSLMISNFTDNLKLKIGNEIQIDEMEYKTKGKESWFIDCIDTNTRFMVSSKYAKSRSQEILKNLMKRIKDKTKGQVETVTTDGLPAYENIVKKTYGWNKRLRKYNIIHNRIIASKGEGFNHKIERLHNSIRHRTKTFRGFKSLESAEAIMKGYEIFYNFIRKHQAINKCPYELATDLRLGINKWLDLINFSIK